MKRKHFKLVRYDELIPLLKTLKFNKESFFDFSKNYFNLCNSSKTIILDEDCLSGFEKGTIFVDSNDFSKELEWELLRPITERQMLCFRTGMNVIFDYRGPFYTNRPTQVEIDLLNELFDCFDDMTRCYKKKYVSYSEFLLFMDFIEIVTMTFTRIENQRL